MSYQTYINKTVQFKSLSTKPSKQSSKKKKQTKQMKEKEKEDNRAIMKNNIENMVNEFKRKDCRDLMVFSIDKEVNKIKDDAISFRKISPEVYELGLHCADIISELDSDSDEYKEYLSVEDIQQEKKLKNHLGFNDCKAFSVFVHLNIKQQEIVMVEVGRTWIQLKATFTFETFTQLIENKKFPEGNKWINNKVNVDKQQLYNMCKTFVNLIAGMKIIVSYEEQLNQCIGSVILAQYGNYFNRIVGKKLKDEYNELALVKLDDKERFTAKFRSPLRSKYDRCVIRQIMAHAVHMSNKEMMYFVNGSDDVYKFKELQQKITQE